MDKRKVLAALWDVQSDVLAKIPFSCLAVSREDFEVDFSAIWGDVGYTAILGPCYLPVVLSVFLAHERVANILATPTGA